VTVEDLLGKGPVIPVTELSEVKTATAVARALLAGGICTIEVTLRTKAALEAIRRIADEVPDIFSSAPVPCLLPSQSDRRGSRRCTVPRLPRAVGANFSMSCNSSGLPFLAGCSGPSELIGLLERDSTLQSSFLRSDRAAPGWPGRWQARFPTIKLCPTGG